MRTSHNAFSFQIDAGLFVGLSILLLILPIKWILSWLLAAAVHELSHYAALRLCGVTVASVRLGVNGAKMRTGEMSNWQECIGAMAGPLSGILLVLFGYYLPEIAVCAFLQTVFNMIPLTDFDGGRIINCILRFFLRKELADRISNVIETVTLVILLSVCMYAVWTLKAGLLPLVAMIVLIFRRWTAKFPCKRRKQIVQCIRLHRRGTLHERTAAEDSSYRSKAGALYRR